MTHLSIPKSKKARKKRRGMARPDEPLADWCEVHRADICMGRATQRHHRRLRTQGGGDEKENTLDVCVACHDWIHANRSVARAHHYIIDRGGS